MDKLISSKTPLTRWFYYVAICQGQIKNFKWNGFHLKFDIRFIGMIFQRKI